MSGDSYLRTLIDRVTVEGPVLPLDSETVGIFGPELAVKIEAANAEGLKLPGSLSSLARKGDRSDEMDWRDVRALLVQRSRQLNTPSHLRPLYERMRTSLAAKAGRTLDLTPLTVNIFSRSLLPLIIDGLPKRAAKRVAGHQETQFRGLSGLSDRSRSFGGRISDALGQIAAGRAVSRHVKERADGVSPARDDYVQALVPLVDRIGVARTSYLVMTLLTAIGSPPGLVASCILYELLTRPEWRARLKEELAALRSEELYATATQKLPVTRRFVKEAMRVWPFPLVTHRVAYRELCPNGIRIGERSLYDLSPYVQHHSERHWKDPERFDPDRWLTSDQPTPSSAYVPFGFGPRSCVGASVGVSQLILFCQLATCEFDFELAAGPPPSMELGSFAIPRGLVATIQGRTLRE